MNILKLAALILASSMAFAEVPQLINYQGQLTDAQGNPKPGTANLSFTIYDSASGTNVLWGPQTFSNVPLIEGSFNIILGPNDDSDAGSDPIADAFATPNSYLQINDMGSDTDIANTSDDTEIKPRQRILSAPYAMQATNSINSRYEVPVGSTVTSILPYAQFVQTVSDPTVFNPSTSKWAPADGRSIVGSKLSALNGQNSIPDFRGVFERGLNTFDPARGSITGAYADPEGVRIVGSMQTDLNKAHRHMQFAFGYHKGYLEGTVDTSPITFMEDNTANAYAISRAPGVGTEANTLPGQTVGGVETRPDNIAVYKYIRIN